MKDDDYTDDDFTDPFLAIKEPIEARQERLRSARMQKLVNYTKYKADMMAANTDLNVGQVIAGIKRLSLMRRLELAFEIVFKRYSKGYDEYGQPLESDIRSATASDLRDKDAN